MPEVIDVFIIETFHSKVQRRIGVEFSMIHDTAIGRGADFGEWYRATEVTDQHVLSHDCSASW
jgi:hypothetical protein